MKFAFALTLLLALAPAASAREFKLYAILLEDTKVELSDGAVWMMDKGDVFPVEAYKNQQKNIILRLAGATFATETSSTRILKAEEIAAGLEVYRKTVRAYLDSTSKKIQQRLQPEEGKEKKPAQ
jgi:predicted DNA-binding protein (UPF0251 family)